MSVLLILCGCLNNITRLARLFVCMSISIWFEMIITRSDQWSQIIVLVKNYRKAKIDATVLLAAVTSELLKLAICQKPVADSRGAAVSLLTGCISQMVKILHKSASFLLKISKIFLRRGLCPSPDPSPYFSTPLFPSSGSPLSETYWQNDAVSCKCFLMAHRTVLAM